MPSVDYNCKVPVLQTSSTDFEGRAVSCSSFGFDDPSTRYKGLTAVDFCLENQQAVGFTPKPSFFMRSSSAIDSLLDEHVKRTSKSSENE